MSGIPSSPVCAKACFAAAAKLGQNIGNYGKAAEYFQKVALDWSGYEHAGWAQFSCAYCIEKMVEEGYLPAEDAEPVIVDVYRQVMEDYPDTRWAERAESKLESYK